jgi:hypothetical protein
MEPVKTRLIDSTPLPWGEITLSKEELIALGLGPKAPQRMKKIGYAKGYWAALIRIAQSGDLPPKSIEFRRLSGGEVDRMLSGLKVCEWCELLGLSVKSGGIRNWRMRGASQHYGVSQLLQALKASGRLEEARTWTFENTKEQIRARKKPSVPPTGEEWDFFGEEPGFARLYVTGTHYHIGPVRQTEAAAAACTDESRRRINRRVVRTIGERRYIDLPDQTVGLVEGNP